MVYGIGEEWCLAHEDMDKMKKSELLRLLMDDGALVIQAHPFREATYIDHIRLFPRNVHGVETTNANRSEQENQMAKTYAENYDLIQFAGSDNHRASGQKKLAGISCEAPIDSVADFIDRIKAGKFEIFTLRNE